jgi:hypothetical protein
MGELTSKNPEVQQRHHDSYIQKPNIPAPEALWDILEGGPNPWYVDNKLGTGASSSYSHSFPYIGVLERILVRPYWLNRTLPSTNNSGAYRGQLVNFRIVSALPKTVKL